MCIRDRADGSARLLGFSFSGSLMPAGSGDAFLVTFAASASEPTDVSLCSAGEVVSDAFGAAYITSGGCGSVSVDVEGINVSLSTDAGPLDQGDSGTLTVSMSNPYPVYGVELHISDVPESVSAIDVVSGDNVPEGTLSFSEVYGELIVLWLSLIHI